MFLDHKKIELIGTLYKKKGQYGDFEWQIKSRLYEVVLWIYNDDEKRRKWKKQYAVIRKYTLDKPRSSGYNKLDKPRSSGYNKLDKPRSSGYNKLDKNTKKVIDEDIDEIRR
jgi:hypothetical protein